VNEEEARRLLLVRAVETVDTGETLLTREDRRHAGEAALAQGGGADGRREAQAYLARRSAFALERLEGRFPVVEKAERSARWPGWANWLLPVLALAAGLATNEIESGKRLNIIAFPLLGMLAWNFAAYVLLFVGAARRVARRGREPRPNVLARAMERLARPATRMDAQPPLGRALARFGQDWLRYSAKISYSRASRTLHLSAALLAGGVLLGMYLRALGVEYRAGWESTFVGAGTLERALGLVLGPASALTGIGLPDTAQLDALRWERGAGENAGHWIHLYAATAALFIIGPRLALGMWHGLRVLRLRRHFPVPGEEDFYVRRLLRGAGGGGSRVRIVPYSFHPPEATQRDLKRLLGDLLGERMQVTIDQPVPYGEEDGWLEGSGLERDDADHLLLLFNLSATPEAENQGAFAAGARRRVEQGQAHAALTALLDESSYRRRLAGQGGAEERLETRRAAWEKVLSGAGVPPLPIDLDSGDLGALSRALEGALMRAGGTR
jgi:hypothetical protein